MGGAAGVGEGLPRVLCYSFIFSLSVSPQSVLCQLRTARSANRPGLHDMARV